MALLDVKFTSEALGLSVSVNVIMPQKRKSDEKFKVLWLLHGYSDDHSGWCRQTSIERYVEGKNLCVIMPAVDLSYYADMAYGNNYFTYVSEELPKVMANMLPISTKKEDNYIAGLSMGGYGAFKLALNQPERFEAAASLSGALDMQAIHENIYQNDERFKYQAKLTFGSLEKFIGSESDIKHMAEIGIKEGNISKLYMCCGTEDFLYEINQGYLKHLKSLNIPVTYEEEKGYGHTWDYWDLKIQRVLEWMGL